MIQSYSILSVPFRFRCQHPWLFPPGYFIDTGALWLRIVASPGPRTERGLSAPRCAGHGTGHRGHRTDGQRGDRAGEWSNGCAEWVIY